MGSDSNLASLDLYYINDIIPSNNNMLKNILAILSSFFDCEPGLKSRVVNFYMETFKNYNFLADRTTNGLLKN
jgi:hypothetical protein